jgi:hypothetical protein
MRKTISIILLILLVLFLISSGLFLSVAIFSAAVVPLTWMWGLITGQSYDRVCDNSEVIYKLNQIGKWTIVIGIAICLMGLVFFCVF